MEKVILISQFICVWPLFATGDDPKGINNAEMSELPNEAPTTQKIDGSIFNVIDGRLFAAYNYETETLCIRDLLNGPESPILTMKNQNEAGIFLDEARTKLCKDILDLLGEKICELLQGATKFTDSDECVKVPQVLKKQPFWPEVEALLSQLEDDAEVEIPTHQYDALIDRSFELLSFFHLHDNFFNTGITDNMSYTVLIADRTGLGDTFRLSDLTNQQITDLEIYFYSTISGEPGCQFRYYVTKTTSVDEVIGLFKYTLEQARKVLINSISAEFPLSMIHEHEHDQEEENERFLVLVPSDMGKKLNPEWSETPDCPWLQIQLNKEETAEQFLTEEHLIVCRDVCELVRNEIYELLHDTGNFTYRHGYQLIPDLLEKQQFWPEVEALLSQLNDDVWVAIPAYQYDALVAKLGE